jgi:hypothetical protein
MISLLHHNGLIKSFIRINFLSLWGGIYFLEARRVVKRAFGVISCYIDKIVLRLSLLITFLSVTDLVEETIPACLIVIVVLWAY